MTIPVFKTTPFFQSRPWGGRAMAEVLGKDIPDGPVAESWEVSAHPNGVSLVSGGKLHGMRLDELALKAGPELLGARAYERYEGSFPLLVKLIDVSAQASVQVHPNDEQARRLDGYRWGKTEAWYIIHRSPSASFSLGLVPGATRESLEAALQAGNARSLLTSPEVAAGDCLFVPPGTVHAAGNGILLLEIQQSSDLTYRVYDWDRVDASGVKRELHVEKALQVIDFSSRPGIFRAQPRPDALSRILASEVFVIEEARVAASVDLPPRPSLSTGTVVDGGCVLLSGGTRIELRGGDSFVVPSGVGSRLQQGPATVIMTFLDR